MNISKLFKRQLDLVKPKDLEFPILVVGAGGIGSYATFALAKMGCTNITVVDFDTVETHNLPSQMFKSNQVGLYKATSLKENILDFTDVEIKPIVGKVQDVVNKDSDYAVIVIAVDSLKERLSIWNVIKENTKWSLYIDARMGGELFRLLTISPLEQESMEKYERGLNSKRKPHIEQCTARAVVYNTFLIGGTIASTVKKFAKEEEIRTDYTFDISQNVVI